MAAKREREAAPVEVEPEITGNHQGAELDAARDTRAPLDRIRRLEKGRDEDRADLKELTATVSDMRVENAKELGDVKAELGKVSGQLEVLPELISVVRKSAERAETRHDKRDDMEAEDKADARKHKRERITKVVGAVVGLLSSGAFLHYLMGKL